MKIAIALFALVCALGFHVLLDEDYDILKQNKEYFFQEEKNYDLKKIQGPRATGFALKFLSNLVKMPILGNLFLMVIKKTNNIGIVRRFASHLSCLPLYYPINVPKEDVISRHENSGASFSLSEFAGSSHLLHLQDEEKGFRYWSIEDYITNYKLRKITPLQVAKAILKAISISNTMDPPLNAIIFYNEDHLLSEAKLSSKRWKDGKPIGLLDGVPIAIKDEIDVKGFATTYGTSFLSNITGIVEEDCMVVKRLREAGALIIGKTNLHEIDIGTTGHNPFYGAVRNPYNKHHYTGGSSSGAAAAVASGLVPVSIGADGGGSIRIPSSLCGVYGLKATFQRIPSSNALDPSLSHVGPIAASAKDLALTYAIIAGSDYLQPKIHVSGFTKKDRINGLRIGVYRDYFNDAQPQVVKTCNTALKYFKEQGADIVDVHIPHLNKMRLAHAITILTEMATFMDSYSSHLSSLAFESQISIALGQSFSSRDFLAAQKVRNYATKVFSTLFQDVDVLITPTTAITAPELHEDAVKEGESNVQQTAELMRFVSIANLIGIPAISFPVGYDSKGLPISLQVMANYWEEDLLLHMAKSAEYLLPNGFLKPNAYYFSILDDAQKY